VYVLYLWGQLWKAAEMVRGAGEEGGAVPPASPTEGPSQPILPGTPPFAAEKNTIYYPFAGEAGGAAPPPLVAPLIVLLPHTWPWGRKILSITQFGLEAPWGAGQDQLAQWCIRGLRQQCLGPHGASLTECHLGRARQYYQG
jgi:hypothetical protein